MEEIRSETGTTYIWPSTPEGGVATFRCPLVENRMEIISRRCGVGGVWESFNEEACGVVNEQLNRLNSSFNNVSQKWRYVIIMAQLYNMLFNSTV